MTGALFGRIALIPGIKIEPTGDLLPFNFRRLQFPVRLSFAMTINKSQGQTFDKVGILLEKSVFTHGQLYVALSRVKSMSSLFIKTDGKERFVRNVVFPEVLLL